MPKLSTTISLVNVVDGSGFLWNSLKEEDIPAISTTNKGVTYEYEGNGWWYIHGTVTGNDVGTVTLYGVDSTGNLITTNEDFYIYVETNTTPLLSGDDSQLELRVAENTSASMSSIFINADGSGICVNNTDDILTFRSSDVSVDQGGILHFANDFVGVDDSVLSFYTYADRIHLNIPHNTGYRVAAIRHSIGAGATGKTISGRIRLMIPEESSDVAWAPSNEDLYPITVMLANSNHSFAGDTNHALADSVDCAVLAHKGSLPCPATVGTITGLPTGMTYTITGNGTTLATVTFTVTTSMVTEEGTVTVPVTVENKEYNLVFSYSIAFKGATGANGKMLYGTSDTGASTHVKVVDCLDANSLYTGLTVTVKFTYANTSVTGSGDNLSLNVNDLGAVPIYFNGALGSDNLFLWGAGAEIQFTYNGNYWVPVGHPCSYYGGCTDGASTVAKTSAISGAVICKGTHVSLKMTNGNSAASPTLNISGTGDKTIYAGGTAIPSGSYYNWVSLASVGFTFDGQYWVMDNTTDLYLVNGKNKVFYQGGTAPASSVGLVEGDTWFDTANGYQLNKWNGTQWVPTQFGSDALAANCITAAHIMAGIITSDMISANGISASKIVGDILSSVDGRNFFDLEEGYFRSEAWEEIGDDEELFGAAEIRGGTHLSSRVDDFVTYDDHTKTIPVEYGAAKIFGGALELDVPCGLGNTYPYAYLAPDGTYGIEVKSAYIRYIAENNYTTRKFLIECDDPIWIGGDENDTWLEVTDSEIEAFKQLFAHQSIELYNDSGNSPYIDFHRTGSTNNDYDSRIICNADGQLQFDHKTSGTKTRFTDGNIDMFASNPALYFHFNKAANSTARIEETSSGVLKAYNSIANGSDERLKKDIVEMDERFLDLLDRLEPKAYRFKDGDEYLNLGFIAQDVIKAMTDLGIEDQPLVVGTGEGDDYYGLDYNQIIPILVGTVQKLKKEVEKLKQIVGEK